MSVYRLHYFNWRGRAELARYLFAIAEQEYEDVRFDRVTEWPLIKPTMPFGQVPVLEIKEGDKSTFISQSIAIARFLARKFKLDGNSELEKAQVDMVAEQLTDVLNELVKAHFETGIFKIKKCLIILLFQNLFGFRGIKKKGIK